MTDTVLILGAHGRFGRNAAEAFGRAGWTVRRFDRKRDALATAADGADVIVNAWNPPYPDWARQVPKIHAQVRDVARVSGSLVVLPGNVYVFGAQTPTPWSADSPHAAANPLGRIRIEMEEAYRNDTVRTLVLRAGDFIDTQNSGNWFDRIMLAKLTKDTFVYPGDTTTPHAWAFLPDLARAAVSLAEKRDSLPRFADIPFPGWTATGDGLAQALGEASGRPLKTRKMNWTVIRLLQPVWPMARSLVEMRYLWDTPHWLDRGHLDTWLPGFEITPLVDALRQVEAVKAA
ncbi:MAG: epimerase [Pseudomonadota bacterium]